MKKWRRISALLLPLAMLPSMLPVPAFAEETEEIVESVEEIETETEQIEELEVETEEIEESEEKTEEIVELVEETDKQSGESEWKVYLTAISDAPATELDCFEYQNSSAFSGVVTVNVGDSKFTETEPNDTMKAAMEIADGDTASGSLTEFDVDEFQFDLPYDGMIIVTSKATTESFVWGLADSTGKMINTSVEADASGDYYGDILGVELSAGTYYLVAIDECGLAADYYFDFQTHSHTFEETVIDPTSTEDGYTKHTCSECGSYYIDTYTPATEYSVTDEVEACCVQDLGRSVVSTSTVSGNLNVASPSKHEIQQKWEAVAPYTSIYEVNPSVSAPYSAGKLSTSFLENGTTYLNFIRYIAKLPDVQMDKDMNESAQYGATLMAATKTMTHYPSKPSGMNNDFYKQGYDATSSSNIAVGYTSLSNAIAGWMDDDIGNTNLSNVSHRRWLLNPSMKNIGFGFAKSDYCYSAAKVMDSSGKNVNYDFVAWPASGNFPSNFIPNSAPWSITLNSSKYMTPSLKQVKITVTRESDGKTWKFDGNTGSTPNAQKGYFTIDTKNYGVNNCLIFHLGTKNVPETYSGVYTVEVSGIYKKDGSEAKLNYQIDFFELDTTSNHNYVAVTTAPTCVEQGFTTYTCECGSTYKDDYVPATGHSYKNTVVAPSCTERGYTSHVCSACGNKYNDSYVSELGHSYKNNQNSTCMACGFDQDSKVETIPMYRLYNPNSGEHFYTGSTSERNALSEAGWAYEGEAWNAPVSSGKPVYRLCNPNTGDHHYTMSQQEVDMLKAGGWQYEGIAWNSVDADTEGAIPLYRIYNPNAECGSHHYTSSEEERDVLIAAGWEYEGIGWYGLEK